MRTILFNNLPLKIVALLLAVTMWGFVASQQRGESTEIKFTVPLVLKNIPKDLELTSAAEESVGVLVRVRRDLAKSINPNQFQVGIDLRNQLAGAIEYALTDLNLTYNNQPLPAGVDVLQISPNRIPLLLEPTFEKKVSIRPRFSGDLAPGFVIESITIKPRLAPVRGPRAFLDKLKSIPTRPLDVQDLRTDVEMLVDLDLPSSIRLTTEEGQFFRAFIKVNNNPTRVLIRRIPVMYKNARYSHKASVSLINALVEGPRNVLPKMDTKRVFALIDMTKYPPGDYRGLAPKIILPDTVKVLEQWPILDLFVLKRRLDNKPANNTGKKAPGKSAG